MSSLPPWSRRCAILLLLAPFLCRPLHATDITDVRWQGEDVMIRFSDSVRYTTDLAESDSNQVILRISPLQLPSSLATELQGPVGRSLLLTVAASGELRVTVRSTDRMGYGTIWRPYTNTLIIHTFRWKQLGYAEEQYFMGLLAFEQQLPAQGIEFLRLAYAAGERRAASALGIYYARHGEEALAAQYLTQPVEADDFAALADVKRAMGDTLTAADMERSFRRLSDSRQAGIPAATPEHARAGADSASTIASSVDNWFSRENLPTIAIIGGGLLLVIVLFVVLPRRTNGSSGATARSERDEGYNEMAVNRGGDTPSTTDIATPGDENQTNDSMSDEALAAQDEPATRIVEAASLKTSDAPSDDAEQKAVAEPHDRRSRLASQAEELRRRIDEVRAKSDEETIEEMDREPDPSIVSEARRLSLSRDSVELRRLLENAR